jgi:hypothetical protein
MAQGRVVMHGNFWYGEVYTEDHSFLEDGWYPVTHACLTKLGAEVALRLLVRKHTAYEFEL